MGNQTAQAIEAFLFCKQVVTYLYCINFIGLVFFAVLDTVFQD